MRAFTLVLQVVLKCVDGRWISNGDRANDWEVCPLCQTDFPVEDAGDVWGSKGDDGRRQELAYAVETVR